MNRLTINGRDVTENAEGLQALSVSFLLNESNRTVSYAATGSIVLYGEGYEVVKPLITDWSLQYEAVLTVDDLQPLQMTVNGRNISDCGCTVELALQTSTENKIAYERIAREIISQGGYWSWMASNGGIAKVPYCYEPNFVTYILLSLYILFRPLINFIQIVLSLFTDLSFDEFGNYVLGCTKYHYTGQIQKTVKYRADLAGIGWVSSILQTKFPNLHLLDAYGYEGRSKYKSQPTYDTNYIVNYTVPQLLDLLRVPFNADYRIIDGVLYFERKDWFANNAAKLVVDEIEDYCVEIDPDMMWNSIRFDWANDPMDETAQQVQGRYSGRVDLNPSEWKTLKESRQVSPRFAPSRFVSDGYGDQIVRKFRESPFVGQAIKHDLVLARGQTYELRLLDLQAGSGGYRKVKYRQVGSDFMYQDQLSFKGVAPQATNLYSEYFDIDDPYTNRRYFIRELTVKPSNVCDAIDLIQRKSMNVYVDTRYGKAIPSEIEYQTREGIFVLKDCTVWQ